MKKSIRIIYFIIMILFLSSTVSNAFNVEFKANNENIKFNEEVILNVNTDENVIATNFYIEYDDSKFEFIEGINISVAENGGKLACIYADITGAGRDNFQVKFKAKERKKQYKSDFKISEYKFVSANSNISYNDENFQSIDKVTIKVKPTTGNKFIIIIGIVIFLIISVIYFKCKKNKSKGLFIIFALFITVVVSTNSVNAVSDTELRVDLNNQILNGEKCLLIALDNSDFDREITKAELVQEAQKKIINIASIQNRDGQNVNDENVVGTGYKAIIDNNEYIVILYGDANGDGYICDSSDIVEIINDYLGKKQLSNEYRIAANLMNNDNKLDADDIMQMINRFLGKLNSSIVLKYPGNTASIPTENPPTTNPPTTNPPTTNPPTTNPPTTNPPTTNPPTTNPPTTNPPNENIEIKQVKVGNINKDEENISGIKLQIKDSSGNIVKNGNMDYFISDTNGNITFDFKMSKDKFELPEVRNGITKGENDFATFYTIEQVCEEQDKKDEYFLNNGYYCDGGITYLTIVNVKNDSNDSYSPRIYINSYRLLYDKIEKADGTYGKVALKDGYVCFKLIHEKEEEKCFLKYDKIVSEYDEETQELISKMHVSITNPKYTFSYFYNEDLSNKIVVEGTETDIRIYENTEKINFILTDTNGNSKTTTVNINHQTPPSENTTMNLKVININSNNEYLSGIKYKLGNEDNIYTTDSNGIINIPLDLKMGENEILLYQSEQLSGYSWDESVIKIGITRSSNSISSSVEARTGRLDILDNKKTILVDSQNKLITIRVIHVPQD